MKSSVLAFAAALFLSSVCAQTAPAAAAPGVAEAMPVFGLRLGQDRISELGTRVRNPQRVLFCPARGNEEVKDLCIGQLFVSTNLVFRPKEGKGLILLNYRDRAGHTPRAYKLAKTKLAMEGQNVDALFHDDVLIEISPLGDSALFDQIDFSQQSEALIASLDAKYRKVGAEPNTYVDLFSKRDAVRHSWLDASGQVQVVFEVSTTTVTDAAKCLEFVRVAYSDSRATLEAAKCRLTVPYPNPAHLYYRHVPLYERAMEAAVKLNEELKAGKAASDAANLKRF